MLRLGVVGGTEDWQDVARRLRGAGLNPDAPPGDCDAVVLLAAGEGAVERLLGAGKHVLLADESALSDERLAAWSALARPGGQQLALLNRERYRPSRQLLRQQLGQNLGEPGLVRLHRWAAALSPADLTRDLDVVSWLVGRAPQVVNAFGEPGGPLQVHLGFPGGGMALIAHAAGPAFAAGYCSLSVIASSGAAYADDHASSQLHFTAEAAQAVRASEDGRALVAMVQSFVDALLTGKDDFSAGLSDWRKVLAVGDNVGNSLAAGRAFSLEGT